MLRSGMDAGSWSVTVYMSAVKSPPQRCVGLPRHGMVQLLDAPKRVMLARSPLPVSSQLWTEHSRRRVNMGWTEPARPMCGLLSHLAQCAFACCQLAGITCLPIWEASEFSLTIPFPIPSQMQVSAC